MMDHLGIPCLDMAFTAKPKAVYPYHSNYDSYHWVDKFGDVGFKKHLAMAQLFGVLAVKLAGAQVIPFKAAEYPSILMSHATALAKESGFDLLPIQESLRKFKKAAQKLDETSQAVGRNGYESEEKRRSSIEYVNSRYMGIEKSFLSGLGLPGRSWFKHIVSRRQKYMERSNANNCRYLHQACGWDTRAWYSRA
jgi:N-acetylated-alpha-linked acidic dipeptidase